MILEHAEETGGFTAEIDSSGFTAEMNNISDGEGFQWIRPAEDIEKWTVQNGEMIAKVEAALLTSVQPLPEPQLWEILADACSPEWQQAKAALALAEKTLARLTSPEFAPLGLIGGALDSHETNEANDHLIQSLVQFTVINEQLRSRADLNRLLGVLLVQQRSLHATADISLQAKEMTKKLDVALDAPQKANRSLREKFQRYTLKLLKNVRPEPAAAKNDPLLHEVNQ
jgi:hypothetical protein